MQREIQIIPLSGVPETLVAAAVVLRIGLVLVSAKLGLPTANECVFRRCAAGLM